MTDISPSLEKIVPRLPVDASARQPEHNSILSIDQVDKLQGRPARHERTHGAFRGNAAHDARRDGGRGRRATARPALIGRALPGLNRLFNGSSRSLGETLKTGLAPCGHAFEEDDP